MSTDDASLVVGLLRVVQREMAAGFESLREETQRLREAIERHALDQEDQARRIAVLEQSAAKRRAVGRK